MTHEEFTQILAFVFGDPQSETPRGLYHQVTLTPEIITLWHSKLGHLPYAPVKKALGMLFTQDPRNVPALDSILETFRTLVPHAVPIPAWQQEMARERGLTVPELLAQARPAHDAVDVGRCFLAMLNAGLMQPGQEAAYLAACQRYAQAYPQDRAFWEAHIAKHQQEITPVRRRTVHDQVETLTRLGTLLQGGLGHA